MLTGILHVTESAENASARQDADFETILEHLNAVYCGKIAHEFMHLPVSTTSWENKWEITLIIDNTVCKRATLVVSRCWILEQASALGWKEKENPWALGQIRGKKRDTCCLARIKLIMHLFRLSITFWQRSSPTSSDMALKVPKAWWSLWIACLSYQLNVSIATT